MVSGKKSYVHKIWYFLWEDDSVWSWVANLVIAFILIRFMVYPILGLVLGTSFPIVAVVSESMEHGLHDTMLCGQNFEEFHASFDNYWNICGSWYENRGITKDQFEQFPFKDGFNKGDVIILWRANRDNLKVGNILIFVGDRPQPIIHRIIAITQEDGKFYYQTKGDHNSNSIEGGLGETHINERRVLGKGAIRIPYLGWIKILFVEAVRPLGIVIER